MTDRLWSYVELANGGAALVDDDDLHLIEGRRWRSKRERTCTYAVASRDAVGHTPRMHRLILGVTDPMIMVDHVNGNGLDNRRSNIRFATQSQNQANRHRCAGGSSSYKGVTLNRAAGRWQAAVKVNGRCIYLGLFESEYEAARAYDSGALEHFGMFACLNFPPEVRR